MLNPIKISCLAMLGAALLTITGCGETPAQKQDKDFFTSGNREADQRADQRMAQANQLNGDTNNGGQKTTKSDAVIAEDKKPLFDRLGGADGINHIVDDWVTRSLADPRVNWDRIGVKRGGLNPMTRGDSVTWDSNNGNVKLMKMHIAQFLAVSTGGPSQYTGKQMKQTHAGMHISNPEFDACLGDLKATLDNQKIANTVQKELLSVVESTREQVVEDR